MNITWQDYQNRKKTLKSWYRQNLQIMYIKHTLELFIYTFFLQLCRNIILRLEVSHMVGHWGYMIHGKKTNHCTLTYREFIRYRVAIWSKIYKHVYFFIKVGLCHLYIHVERYFTYFWFWDIFTIIVTSF